MPGAEMPNGRGEAMDIGRPQRIIEIEPVSLPVPSPELPMPMPDQPIHEPSPAPTEPADP